MESKISPHCVKCLQPCSGEALKYNDRIFHSSCLTCGVCNVNLSSRGFFFIEDRYYCTDDYHDLFGIKCHSCNQFVEGDSVTALGNTYHQDCFVCYRCKTPFPPGDEISYTGKNYLCQKCAVAPERRTIPVHKCAGCTQEIKSGQALLALDKHWHLWCFTCTKCRTLLSGEYMGRDGKPYCERDYQAEFGVTCAGCGGYITGKVLQAGEKHYHPQCSRCAKCHREFGEGEEMYLQGSEIWHPDCSRVVAAEMENGDQDSFIQTKEKTAKTGQEYDAAVERPLVATQKQEVHVAPDENKVTRPTKEFDVSERGPVQMNGDLDDQPPRPPPPERTAASRASEWKRKISDGPPTSSSIDTTKPKRGEYQRSRPYSFHESSLRAPGFGNTTELNEKRVKTFQRKVSSPSQRPTPPALQVRRHSSDNSEMPFPVESNGGKYAHHRRSMPTVLTDEVPMDKQPHKSYRYEELKTSNYKLPRGVDRSKLEAYLTDVEFKDVFSMERQEFYRLPKWKQDSHKKKVSLF